ncbi:hypothetical protein EDB86DRAFT_2833440 [Lactarius hatsudake]|nr:hypothetical protein EDB86DRAFT_2833440 [Lactarius hatsudake]
MDWVLTLPITLNKSFWHVLYPGDAKTTFWSHTHTRLLKEAFEDLLHQVIKGTVKDHLVEWVTDYLYIVHRKASAKERLADIDQWSPAVFQGPWFQTMDRQRNDSKALMKVYLPAITWHTLGVLRCSPNCVIYLSLINNGLHIQDGPLDSLGNFIVTPLNSTHILGTMSYSKILVIHLILAIIGNYFETQTQKIRLVHVELNIPTVMLHS